mmetsp:Transcript_3553/g.13797  ORF Transcript_3553/g.13797 Transcript_3553/m.13797 type:complete len:278 (+) Transcript_3553:858-1691(+)
MTLWSTATLAKAGSGVPVSTYEVAAPRTTRVATRRHRCVVLGGAGVPPGTLAGTGSRGRRRTRGNATCGRGRRIVVVGAVGRRVAGTATKAWVAAARHAAVTSLLLLLLRKAGMIIAQLGSRICGPSSDCNLQTLGAPPSRSRRGAMRAKKSREPGFARAPRSATGRPASARATAISTFLPLEVVGMAGQYATIAGTCRGEARVRMAWVMRCTRSAGGCARARRVATSSKDEDLTSSSSSAAGLRATKRTTRESSSPPTGWGATTTSSPGSSSWSAL